MDYDLEALEAVKWHAIGYAVLAVLTLAGSAYCAIEQQAPAAFGLLAATFYWSHRITDIRLWLEQQW